MNVPIIKLEIGNMKHTVLAALTQHTAKIDESIRKSLDLVLSDANIESVVTEAVSRSMKEALESNISDYFKHGKGRDYVRDAVKSVISKSTDKTQERQ